MSTNITAKEYLITSIIFNSILSLPGLLFLGLYFACYTGPPLRADELMIKYEYTCSPRTRDHYEWLDLGSPCANRADGLLAGAVFFWVVELLGLIAAVIGFFHNLRGGSEDDGGRELEMGVRVQEP
ncbi:MAG: hypothetical protein Q9218_007390, partial [Villophora microphyllina]